MSKETSRRPSRSESDFRIREVGSVDVFSPEFKLRLHDALRTLGLRHVKEAYKPLWSENNPGFGYCYVISELIHHLVPETLPKRMRTPEGTHWFLELPDGRIVDFAKDQEYDYSKGVGNGFLTKKPSKRTQLLAQAMGVQV